MNFDFIDRLKEILEHYQLSASSFADKIGVPRSSVSHLLNGRNRPSLDFVMKVVQTFPEVNIYWLLNGKGSFPSTAIENSTKGKDGITPLPLSEMEQKRVEKIVIFYQDGTFESFHPKK